MADTPASAAPMELADILAAINALPDDQHRTAIAALKNDSGPVIKEFRRQVFGDGKREGKQATAGSADDVARLQEEKEDLERQLAEAREKAPDAAKLEERMKGQYQRKLEAEKKRADEALATLATERSSGFRSQLRAAFRDLDIDPDYADDVLAARYADRYQVGPDGSRRVLKPGEDSAYEAPTEAEAVKLLAADVRKTIAPKWLVSHADSGASITNGNGGGGSAFVQAKPPKQQEAEKRAEIGALF